MQFKLDEWLAFRCFILKRVRITSTEISIVYADPRELPYCSLFKKNLGRLQLIVYLCFFNFLNNTMKKGKVKFFNSLKGFGFIQDLETGKDIFVHSSGLQADIREGDMVVFDVETGKKGLNAVNVRLS
jgi:cold shock protein